MAINMSTDPALVGRITTPSTAYPLGSSKNETSAGLNDGTPYNEKRANDLFGFLQAMLAEGGVIPSGDPDTATASQYLDALRNLGLVLVPWTVPTYGTDWEPAGGLPQNGIHYTRSGANVTVYGSVRPKVDTPDSLIATLPVGCRPPYNFHAWTHIFPGGVARSVLFNTDGRITADDPAVALDGEIYDMVSTTFRVA